MKPNQKAKAKTPAVERENAPQQTPSSMPFIQAKNFTKNRYGDIADTIVIHPTCSDLPSAIEYLSKGSSHSSAHFVIGRDGNVTQLVKVKDAAWHTGSSKWNNRSVAIGLEASETETSMTDVQEEALLSLIKTIKIVLPLKYLFTHKELSTTHSKCPLFIFSSRRAVIKWVIDKEVGLKYMLRTEGL